MKKCYIFGALDIATENISVNKRDNDIVIAADSGVKTLEKLNIKADLIIGDFDSLGYVPEGDNIIKHPEVKDDTDTMLSIKKAIDMGYNFFEIYGCIGGRLDHTFANIQAAAYIAENNGTAIFYDVDNKTALTVIKNNEINFSSECSGNISVFSISDNSIGVNEKNLFYELTDAVLTASFPLGVSNKFLGKNALVSVENGKLCIIWDCSSGSFNIGGFNDDN
jgi:thiamine pyrophosphokinase